MGEQTKLHDDDLMEWGKYKGKPLGKIPDWYWIWFLKTAWCDDWPDYVEYANHCLESI